MKKTILILISLLFLAASCAKVEMKREIPSSPQESYQELPE
jgi:uncharacterized MAPEG superfamily protein